jgi:tripartite-type tricarboxylate transporter receptor subunit TctC
MESGTRALKFVSIVLALVALPALGSLALAQQYPSKSIRIIMPFVPGGATDSITRTASQKASEFLGQPILLEHHPGSGGVIAANFAKQQAPDGYTLFLGSTGINAINKALYSKLSYDPEKDFLPITILGTVTSLLAVPASSPAKSVKELITMGKSKRGGLNTATQGIGTPGHLLAEMFAKETGTPNVVVHYNSGPAAMQDTVGGRVDINFTAAMQAKPLIQDNRLRVLAVASKQHSKALPDIPTMPELGYPGVELDFWFGVFALAGTPQPVVRRLYEEYAKALRTPEVSDWLASQDFSPPLVTPEQFAAIVASDIDRLGKIVRAVGARID